MIGNDKIEKWTKRKEEVIRERHNRKTMEKNRTIVYVNEELQTEQKKTNKCNLYLVDSGCKWRQFPCDFPPYSTVHNFYRRARKRELWKKILDHLVKKTRVNVGRKEKPSYGIIDSQSVKTVTYGDECGIDGKKPKLGNDIL